MNIVAIFIESENESVRCEQECIGLPLSRNTRQDHGWTHSTGILNVFANVGNVGKDLLFLFSICIVGLRSVRDQDGFSVA